MVIHKMDTMLFRMIRNSKSQFIAVLIILVVGISLYTSMNMTSINLRNTVESYYEQNNFADLFLQCDAIPGNILDRISQIQGVEKVTGRLTIDAPMVTDDEDERVNIRIVTTKGDQDELCKSTILEGHNLKGTGNEAWLVRQFAEARGIEVGDQITIQAKGIRYTFDVAGIVANPEYVYLMENAQSIMPDEQHFGVCYVSEYVGQKITGLVGSYNEVLVTYSTNNEDQLIDDIKDTLKGFYIKQSVKRKDQLSYAIINEELTNLNAISGSLPILFLLVAGLILMMMLARMVKRDRLKIGVLKAIGYSNKSVILHYVKYAFIAGVLGGLSGSIIGMIISGFMTQLYLEFFSIPLLRTEFYFSYIIIAVVLSILICSLSGFIGAKGVLKISPAEAMREETPKSGKNILLEKVRFIWRRLSFSNKVVLKNVFRNKKRTGFVLMGVVLTYAMMLFTTSMPDVVTQMMDEHYTEFQRMEYNIDFHQTVNRSVIYDLYHIIDIDRVEGKIELPFELANGNTTKTVPVIGISKETEFYSFQDVNNKSIGIPNRGILLSENLAMSLKVKKGDTILIKNILPGKKDVYVKIKGVIKQALGINAYMDIGYMGEILLEPNIITGIYLDSSGKSVGEKLKEASNIATVMSLSETKAVYEKYTQMIVMFIGFMVIFSGLLGFCIVYNATIISIGEREMEFSSLRVLGFSKFEIFRMILKENNMIVAAGILLGIPVGKLFLKYSSSAFSTDMYCLDMDPTLMAAVMAAILTIGFVLLAEAATYRKIKRLDFLQALKNRAG